MISSLYVAHETERLDRELRLIRHFLTHPSAKPARTAFIDNETADYEAGFWRYLQSQGESDEDALHQIMVSAMTTSWRRWATANLHQIEEFSENRLTQMEILVRYALFEGFLLKIMGNILWEYPHLRQNDIHKQMNFSWRKRGHKNVLSEQIAWTRGAIKAVDHLRFAKWRDEEEPTDCIYLWTYLAAIGLEFQQRTYCEKLEHARRVRNYIVHKSLQLPIADELAQTLRSHLSGFPVLLIHAAASKFPLACTSEPPEADEDGDIDDGTPGYEVLDFLEGI
jgi:hypothetical protein